jgi:hypothetical protein
VRGTPSDFKSSERYMFTALARTPLGSVLRHVPFLEATYNHRALERHGQSHLLSGIFSSYAQALASVPRGRPSGWDTEGAAAIFDPAGKCTIRSTRIARQNLKPPANRGNHVPRRKELSEAHVSQSDWGSLQLPPNCQ